MGVLLSYSLACSIVAVLLFPVLHQIVNRSTSFRFNRYALLSGLFLILALPLMLKSVVATVSPNHAVVDIAISEIVKNENIGNGNITPLSDDNRWMFAAFIIYFAGIMVFFLRELLAYVRLFRLVAHSEKTRYDRLVICRLGDSEIAPFSWGRYIFLHDAELEKGEDCILLHEKAHTTKRHWIDILLADTICIVLWYNPLLWLTRRLIKLNHEFEADSAVVRSGIKAYDYQRLLVVKAIGKSAMPISNSFAADKRSFRKRVLIMGKKRSSKRTMLIAVFAIPALIFAGLAIAAPASARLLDRISDYNPEREVLTEMDIPIKEPAVSIIEPYSSATEEPDTIVEIPSPLEDQTFLAEIIKLSMETIQIDKDTKVNIEIAVDEDGRIKNVTADNPDGAHLAAAIDQNLNSIKFEQTIYNGKPIEMHFNIPVNIKKK